MDKTISVLVDNDSWVLPYAQTLVSDLHEQGFKATLYRNANDLQPGWINFLLGCIHMLSRQVLGLHQHNLVVHESDLPEGRGFAPMTWQILEGRKEIPVCLIEASPDEADAGDIWLRDVIQLSGDEIHGEWRRLQGEKTVELCLRAVNEHKDIRPYPQRGEPTWYPRRRPEDSKLDASKPLDEQLNLLRIVDNERYPAFLWVGGRKLIIKIHCED